MLKLLFSPYGRLNRAKFWWATLAVLAVDAVFLIGFFVEAASIPEGESPPTWAIVALVPIAIVLIASFVSHFFIGIKRYHDHSKSGVWVLVQFVPAVGGLWYFIEAGCMRGINDANQYGADPLA